ncbi:MAG: transposase [Gammaproteobacteria bacterium]|nr:transposase [Gammaproteobacteria bacterium]MYG97018.1 transposase [Gammaproteobacteria bacterium]
MQWLDDLTDAREKLQACRREYNEILPHRPLDSLSPMKTEAKWAENSPISR